MKKVLALLLALCMIFALAACGQTAAPAATEKPAEPAATEAPAPAEAAGPKTYKVGIAIYQFDDNFMTLYRNELLSYFESLNTDEVHYEVTIVDGKNDMAEQNNQIDNFITQGMDAIILNLVQTSSADAAIAKIVAAGIPCILINREPLGDNGDESYAGILDNPLVCYVGADARQSGTYEGEIIRDLPNHGDVNGDGKVSYIMVVGDPENPDAQYRTEFSVRALTDAGIEVVELDRQIGNWAQAKGQEITANALAKFGNDVEVVFCNNDAMALGAATAITAAGRTVGKDIFLVGVDALEECVQMVENGEMTGTVLNDHIGQSHTAVDVCVAALKGEPIQNYYWVDYVKVAAEPAAEAAPAAAAGPKTYKVGIAIYQFDDNFMTLYRNELLSYFESLNTDEVHYEVTIVDGKNDMAEQNNQIDNFITQGMDAIILNLVQTSSADAAIAKIVEAGIPCILINREPLGDNGDESYAGILDNPLVCYVGADARQSGTYEGEIIRDLPNHGDIDGDGKVSYIMVVGDPENPDAQYRTEFSVRALTDAGIEVVELDKQIGNWAQAKGQEITANALAKFGDKIEVVFCNNDAMALGAATAITAAGRTVGKDIYLVGVDALEECVQMVNNGEMTGTVLNDHIGQSHTAVDVCVAALNGEPIQNYYWVDYVKVAAEPAEEAAPAAEAEPAAAPAAAPAAEPRTFKVGIAIYQFDDNFMTLYRNELLSYFESLNTDQVRYEVTIVDGKNDMAEQNNQIDNFITQGMDAIILNLVQTSSADAAIAKIVEAGIPCILINREPLGDNGDESYAGILDNPLVCYVGADARQSGTYEGEIIRDLPDHGDIDGDGKVSYIMVVGDPENPDAQYRTEFSVRALTDAGIEVVELDKQIGNWAQAKGQEITANALAKFGDKIEVVFCNNDAMALGAATAITAAGRTVGKDIYLVGVDALEECVQMVANGEMTGTVLNDHIGQSHTAVDVCVAALNGEAIQNYYWVDYVKVA